MFTMESNTHQHNEQTDRTHTPPTTPGRKRNQKRKLAQHNFKTHLESHAITNLSSYTLTQSEEKLLIKGLSYTPSFNTQTRDLEDYTERFIRHIYIDHHFKDSQRTTPQFHTKSTWEPPIPTNLQLTQITNNIRNISHIAQFGGPTLLPDIQHEQHQAIQSLANNKHITIKKADKGGSVVIMDTNDYISTALKHLQQTDVYQPQEKDLTKDTADNLDAYIIQLKHTGRLTHRI